MLYSILLMQKYVLMMVEFDIYNIVINIYCIIYIILSYTCICIIGLYTCILGGDGGGGGGCDCRSGATTAKSTGSATLPYPQVFFFSDYCEEHWLCNPPISPGFVQLPTLLPTRISSTATN
jgi:hypothetical protein